MSPNTSDSCKHVCETGHGLPCRRPVDIAGTFKTGLAKRNFRSVSRREVCEGETDPPPASQEVGVPSRRCPGPTKSVSIWSFSGVDRPLRSSYGPWVSLRRDRRRNKSQGQRTCRPCDSSRPTVHPDRRHEWTEDDDPRPPDTKKRKSPPSFYEYIVFDMCTSQKGVSLFPRSAFLLVDGLLVYFIVWKRYPRVLRELF